LTKNRKPTQAQKSALLVGAVLLLIAAWNLYHARPIVAAVIGGAASILVITGWLAPAWAARFHKYWMLLASALGYVNSRLLLGLLYYGVLTPVGVVSRLFGRDALNRRKVRGTTYWVRRPSSRQGPEQFERAF
jgi:hypothetical protein